MNPSKSTINPFKLIFMLILAIVFVFAIYSSSPTSTPPTSYSECIEAKGSVILESYPEQCRTPRGLSFTRELSEDEQKNLVPPESSTHKQYTCPANGYLDCMPKVNRPGEDSINCSPKQISWVKNNCPNFKGVTY